MVLELPPELHLQDEARVGQVIVRRVISVLKKARLVLISGNNKRLTKKSFNNQSRVRVIRS